MTYKRIVSLLLAIVSLLSFSLPAHASAIEKSRTTGEVICLEDATIYTKEVDDYNIVVSVPKSSAQIEIDFYLDSNPHRVYQFFVPQNSVKSTEKSPIVWNAVKELCKNNLSSAKTIDFVIEDVTYDTPIEITNTRGSVASDLTSDLRAIHGEEYEYRRVYTTTYQGEYIKIYEFMEFLLYEAGYKRWSTGEDFISLGAFLAGCMHLSTVASTLTAFGLIFGVVPGIASVIVGSGSLDKYTCIASIVRYASINNSEFAYNYTDNNYSYDGYDDGLTTENRAAIIPETLYHQYSDSASYFNDFDAQVEDAYDMFCLVGQMD